MSSFVFLSLKKTSQEKIGHNVERYDVNACKQINSEKYLLVLIYFHV